MGLSRKNVTAGLAGALGAIALLAPTAHAYSPAGAVQDQATGTTSPRALPLFAGSSLDYQGGPVMSGNRTHVIFWNPSNQFSWDAGYRELISGYLQNVAADSHKATNVYAISGQYTDSFGGRALYDSTFAGALADADPVSSDCTLPLPPPISTGPTLPNGTAWPLCVSNAKLGAEIMNFVTANHLPTGLSDIYFLVTPDGFGSCFTAGTTTNNCSLGGLGTQTNPVTGSFCGFHSAIGPPSETYPFSSQIVYANIPYDALTGHCQSANPRPNNSTADPTLSTVSHEHNETITDPLTAPGRQAWINSDGNEEADLCGTAYAAPLNNSNGPFAYNQAIGTGHYFLQDEWSNDDAGGSTSTRLGCVSHEESDSLNFSSSAPRPTHTPINFAGGAVDPDGAILSVGLNFGDGSATVPTATTSHAYAADGIYQVTMTATDITGQQSSLTRPLLVDAAPIASFSSSPAAPVARRPVRFNGRGSRDPDGSIVSYRWSFGDGITGSGANPKHTYSRGGRFTTALTVTDNLGVSVSHSRTITVAPLPHIRTAVKHRSVRVAVNEAGTVIVGSRHKRLARAGAATFRLRLSAADLRRLHAGHSIRVKVKITFVPRVGRRVTRKITLTIRP